MFLICSPNRCSTAAGPYTHRVHLSSSPTGAVGAVVGAAGDVKGPWRWGPCVGGVGGWVDGCRQACRQACTRVGPQFSPVCVGHTGFERDAVVRGDGVWY
eukprot:3615372-Rhodomonas_salina.1